jgi:hypothetical protein
MGWHPEEPQPAENANAELFEKVLFCAAIGIP